jgi:two-component system NtrC family response regulator
MTSKRPKLLVVEDDPGLQRQLKWAFDGYEVLCAATREQAVETLRRHQPAVVLQDLGLPPDADGVEEGFATIAAIHRVAPRAKIIVVTGREGREHALRAIGMGAHDFCEKPVDAQVLNTVVQRAARIHQLEEDIERESVDKSVPPLEGIVGASESMLKVCRMIERLAPTDTTVLLRGESGTGKERLAHALHKLSPRAGKPIVAINCAAIPENLLESELFGHERGAFTGAVKQTIGQVESADGGTLFLDEIGDMPYALQAKMLRFLQERVIERVGGRKLIPVDVRIVAATNQELETAISEARFRMDLFYRISEVSVLIPPLRERDSDALLIANHLLRQACQRRGVRATRFSPDAVAAIERHSWPGNVRELANRVNRAAVMAEGKLVTREDLGLVSTEPQAPEMEVMSLREVRKRAEVQAVRHALAVSAGNISKAAELLGITRPTLYDLMERMSIRPTDE